MSALSEIHPANEAVPSGDSSFFEEEDGVQVDTHAVIVEHATRIVRQNFKRVDEIAKRNRVDTMTFATNLVQQARFEVFEALSRKMGDGDASAIERFRDSDTIDRNPIRTATMAYMEGWLGDDLIEEKVPRHSVKVA